MQKDRVIGGCRLLGRELGRSHQAIFKWSRDQRWPFGPGPWRASQLPAIRRWMTATLRPPAGSAAPRTNRAAPPQDQKLLDSRARSILQRIRAQIDALLGAAPASPADDDIELSAGGACLRWGRRTFIFTTAGQRFAIQLLAAAYARDRQAVVSEHEVRRQINKTDWRMDRVFRTRSGPHPILRDGVLVALPGSNWRLLPPPNRR